ncbi:MAG: DAK2 domain-containing protein [Clostridiales bacterium]|nr:DAK2 domain-containing protein [Clostridiales bacterium]
MLSRAIDAGMLKKCFIAGANNLEKNKEYINELNVFPVPDGDTGTNMSMTIMTAARALSELGDDTDMKTLAKAMAGGSLRGARGNSGVIMSQLIRGFCKAVENNDQIDPALAAAAFRRGAETAYKAVMKPKEGTILTVAKGMADRIGEIAEGYDSMAELMEAVIEHGDAVLEQTPEMLPVLKEAGVVDSGGQGLMVFLKGALAVLQGKEVDTVLETAAASPAQSAERARISTDDIKFGYCTEFIVNLNEPLSQEKLDEFKGFLESIGDSVVCVADDDLVKVHVHTNHPGQAFEKGIEIGASLSRMKVDNMREEHEEKLIRNASAAAAVKDKEETDVRPVKDGPKKPAAFISVCSGEGLKKIFEGLGADYVIGGGQTMNPSTDDILTAVDSVHAETVFVLPNNKNIILAAEQAARINTDVRILVVPTKTIPQGITALINYTEGLSDEENLEAMSASISEVKSGELTYAVRNTMIDGVEIREGNIMGIGDRGILAVGEVLNDTALEMIEKMVDDCTSIITVYAGEGIDDSSAGMLCDSIRSAYPDIDVDCERGDQPVYYYIISVE